MGGGGGGGALTPNAGSTQHVFPLEQALPFDGIEIVITFKSLSPFSSIHPLSSTLNAKAVTLAVLPVALVVASTEIK